MPIRVECPSCRSAFRVGDDSAGKRGKCPRCKEAITVPAAGGAGDGDLVPIDPPAAPAPAAAAVSPTASTRRLDADDDGGGYGLAGVGRKVRSVPARATGGSAATGVKAEGVARAVAATRPTQTPAQILAAFRGEIEPVRPTPLYLFWAAVVAGLMVLLPVVYLGAIALVAYGVYYHAVNHLSWFTSVHNVRAALGLYAGPLVMGVVVVGFMLKPLFARSAKGRDNRALDPQVEPLLYAFVDGVCTSVGAPRPDRIEVDCQVNASAHLAGGRLAVLNNELVLTIGLPLAAGLDMKQFAGVLAHEFGHFAQGSGMRLSLLIRSINHWFARVVYERDEWDETLKGWATSDNSPAMILGLMAAGAVWLARRLLWVLMYAGHLVSGFLSRQMEYDADRYQARMVGGRAYAATMWRLREMSLAEQGAYVDLSVSWRERRLPDNLPKLILANVPQIPAEVAAKHRKEMGRVKTGLFDTHPCDRDRITRARAESDDGIFHLEGPATDLFRNFDSLARVASYDHYRSLLGPAVSKEQLFTVAELVQTQAVTQEGLEALDRFFLRAYSPIQRLPLEWNYPKPPPNPDAARRAVVKARADMEAARGGNVAALKRSNALHEKSVTYETAWVLLKADNKIKGSDFDLETGSLHAAEAARERVAALQRELAGEFEPFESAAARRLSAALAVLEVDAVAGGILDGVDRREEARVLYTCVAHLGGRVVAEAPLIVRDQLTLGRLLNAYQEGKNQQNQPLINACLRAAGQLHERLDQFRWKVGDTLSYPFEHAQEDVTLARFILPSVPARDDVGALYQAADEAVDRLAGFYRRALGRLALTAEEVERALGLPPIEVEPADE